jgi:hypothetical protein
LLAGALIALAVALLSIDHGTVVGRSASSQGIERELPTRGIHDPTAVDSAHDAAAPDRRAPASASGEQRSRDAASAIAPSGAPSDDAAKSGGPGVIRGRIHAPPGTELPQVWTLIVEPDPYAQGQERAVTRRIELTHGEREFRVDGLPLAGYRVRAVAKGLNDVACSALLVPGSSNVFVTPELRPSGSIEGDVVDAAGAPVEGLVVTITTASTHERQIARTDARGHYVIANVKDGDYSLALGSPDAPLLKPDSLSFKAPSLHFPTRRLPETGTLRVSTVDASGRALMDVEVSGFSSSGGAVRATTDARGTATVRYLLPGKYRLQAHLDDGRKASEWIDVGAQPETSATLVLAP